MAGATSSTQSMRNLVTLLNERQRTLDSDRGIDRQKRDQYFSGLQALRAANIIPKLTSPETGGDFLEFATKAIPMTASAIVQAVSYITGNLGGQPGAKLNYVKNKNDTISVYLLNTSETETFSLSKLSKRVKIGLNSTASDIFTKTSLNYIRKWVALYNATKIGIAATATKVEQGLKNRYDPVKIGERLEKRINKNPGKEAAKLDNAINKFQSRIDRIANIFSRKNEIEQEP